MVEGTRHVDAYVPAYLILPCLRVSRSLHVLHLATVRGTLERATFVVTMQVKSRKTTKNANLTAFESATRFWSTHVQW